MGALQPFGEVSQLDVMLHADVRDGNFDDALLESGDPVVAAEGGQALGDSFVESFGGHVHGVGYAFQVLDGDAARTSRHERKVSYSLFLRHKKPRMESAARC